MDVIVRTPHATHFGDLPFPRSASRPSQSPLYVALATITGLPAAFLSLFSRLPLSTLAFFSTYFSRVFRARSPALILPPYQVIDNRTVFSWKDAQSDAVGWIVIDNPFPTVAGGGLFMHSGASLKEVTDVACAMS
jgi:hypothetical protein